MLISNLLKNLTKVILKPKLRNYEISALFVPGNKAKENFAVLTPHMDFNEISDKPSEIQSNLQRRRMKFNFQQLQSKYENYMILKHKKETLELQREEIAIKLKKLQSQGQKLKNVEIDELKIKGKRLKEELKQLKGKLFPVEEEFIILFLQLPNKIHPKVNSSEHTVLYRKGLPPSENLKNNYLPHISYKNFISFSNESYYLLNDAAVFDLEMPMQCVKEFLNLGYVQCINPDFSKSILLEVAAIDKNCKYLLDEDFVKSKTNLLYLTGGGSLIGFLGFIAKLAVFSSNLPIKLVSSGKEYYNIENDNHNLYTVNQTNAVQIFCATETSEQLEDEMEKVLNLVVDIYNKFDVHFQIDYVASHELDPSESLKAIIKLYSPVCSKYINVGYVSNYQDFISKRLLFSTRDKKEIKFPFILSGKIFDTTRVIACLLENNKNLLIDCKNKDNDSVKEFKNLFT